METIKQQPQTETLNVANILESTNTQHSPQTAEDIDTEGPKIHQETTNEDNDIQNETLSSTINETETKPANIQLPIVDKTNLSNNNYKDEKLVDLSADGDNEDHASDTCNKMYNQNETQQLQTGVEPLSQTAEESEQHKNTSENIKKNDDNDITSLVGKTCKYENEETRNETEEDELLKSDNEDNSENSDVQKDKEVSDSISVEREEELLKSEDEEDSFNDKNSIYKKNIESQEVIVENKQIKALKNTKAKIKKSNVIEEQNDNNVEHKEDIECEKESEESKNDIIDSSNLHDVDDNDQSKKCSSPSVDITYIHCYKHKNAAENHRILYQFDLDDDSSSHDSLNRSKSSTYSEHKSYSPLDKTPENQIHEIITQQSISETTDIKDVVNEENKNEQKKEEGEPLTEEFVSQSPQVVSQLREEDNLIDGKSNNEATNLSNRNENILEDTESSKSPWGSLHSDLSSSKENLAIDNKDSLDENRMNSDTSNSSNDSQFNNKNKNDENDERHSVELPTLNGNHNSRDQCSETKQIENTNNDIELETNLLKFRRTSLDSNFKTPVPHYSPLGLPQNEEAQAEFEDTVNDEVSFNLQDLKTKSNENLHEEPACGNESDLRINKNSGDVFGHENSNNRDVIPAQPLSPLQITAQNDDDVSRSSMTSSASYSSSSTSSSQQLVIDHPMDDVKEEKVKPLRINLKRKLSNLSDDSGPQHKKFYSNENKMQNTYESQQNSLNKDQGFVNDNQEQNHLHMEIDEGFTRQDISKEQTEHRISFLDLEIKDNEPSLIPQSVHQAEQEPFKSLLLQQLEKPLSTPNVAPPNQNILPLNTLHTNIAPQPLPPPSPPPPPPPLSSLQSSESISIIPVFTPPPPPFPTQPITKYLCFKCKTGSFNTFNELEKHQIICLTSASLIIPIHQSTIQPPLPPSPSLPLAATETLIVPHTINNIRNTKTVTTKSAGFSEAKEIGIPSSQKLSTSAKKRYYKCSTCNTFHENWNLFLHIHEQHSRYTCLYCVRFFPTAEKLALHLEIKHDLEQNHFNSEESIRQNIPALEGYALESRFLMCCSCQHIFKENEQFSHHDCAEYIKPCSLCGQKGRHTNQCKAHPDSKRFSKLKKKKEKQSEQLMESLDPPPVSRYQKELTTFPSISMNENHNINPTLASNSILDCDSDRDGDKKHQRLPIIDSLHSEDSNSSSNMVIDESCNTIHVPPPGPLIHSHLNLSRTTEQEISNVPLEPDLPPDREKSEEKQPRQTTVSPIKLVVPKLKLRVPKEFQKSVDDALSTSDSCEEEEEDEVNDGEEKQDEEQNVVKNDNIEKSIAQLSALTREEETAVSKETTAKEINQNSLLASSTPASSQDTEVNVVRNSVTESTTEAGNSQDNSIAFGSVKNSLQNHSLSLDDDDSLDEPNSNLVRIMQEIERTKLDIQQTKKTSSHHSGKQFASPRQPTISQSSNRTADDNWSPTPPASPNSRWFTPRRPTVSQNSDDHHMQPQSQAQHTFLLPPPSPAKQMALNQGRRDTICSDMMDIDETITSQPTHTIYSNELRPLNKEILNSLSESLDKKPNEPKENTSPANVNDHILTSEVSNNTIIETKISANEMHPRNFIDALKEETKSNAYENKLGVIESNILKPDTPEPSQNMDVTYTQSIENDNNKRSKNVEQNQAEDDVEVDVCDIKAQSDNNFSLDSDAKSLELEKLPPADGIEVANEDTVTVDLQLEHSIDKYEIVDFVRVCLKAVYPLCLYCNHARRIAVNGKSLVVHMIGNHRFTATVDSITAEELLPETIVSKLKTFLPHLELHYLNSNSYCTYGEGKFTKPFNERIFECFQCRFVTSTHKELYLHNRKMHLRTAILCFMCRSNFFSFSEILCHICPGVPNKVSVFDVKFRCCLCELDNIPSPFRLMVHLRKKHFACDVCLEDCRDQSKLSSHVWKHKLHHLCYRCGIAYRNKLDITKHLFWKHGTESTICKRCLQKRWRHVYHFCIPPLTFVCEVCNLCFSKAMYLRVHRRLHTGDLKYPCIEDNCEEKFISRKLLLKHAIIHQYVPKPPEQSVENEKEPVTISLEKGENEKGLNEDVTPDDSKLTPELKSIKQEIIEIKKEPVDESERGSQSMLKNENFETAEKKKLVEEGNNKKENLKDAKKENFKDKNRSDLNATHKKRKRSKRSKELLEDLNLTAPNLSESDSSDDDDDSDSDSKTKSEIDALPRVILSPASEAENEDRENKSSEPVEPAQVLEIWKNFLKTQQGSSTAEELERLKASEEENKQPKRQPVHVACSDHDYCKIEPEPQPTKKYSVPDPVANKQPAEDPPKEDFKTPSADITSTPETSPTKRRQSKSPRRSSSRRSDASSSSSDSSSTSDSSCSCGSNCSCSSSDSDSTSSSSSSEDTDSSMASNNSMRKRHRKKSERDRLRKRSESISPLKQHKLSVSITEVIKIDDEEKANSEVRPLSPPKETLLNESDLETNESETDEEFYDEHPQKLANELLAQKRAQLMAQTRLSPSHNYDIVENSRPSTPSLPEEVATNEKPKIKVKKKKRDRKSSCKGQGLHANHLATITEQHMAPSQNILGHHNHQQTNQIMQAMSQTSNVNPPTLINPASDAISHAQPSSSFHSIIQQNVYNPTPPPSQNVGFTDQTPTLTPRPLTMPPYNNSHRTSEGSSCSDADGSLKRSKRQRRPNKFYGYTSDDENLINGPPLMIGTRAFKPQPPPQLTWRKEDLPTPSKSILNNKNKTPRAPKSPATPGNQISSTLSSSSTGKKKPKLLLTLGDKSASKRPAKKKDSSKPENKFPPIPTLKIRPSQIGINTTINHPATNLSNFNPNHDDSSSDEDVNRMATKSQLSSAAAVTPKPLVILPSQPPPPPTPQTTAFNHKIPPALLPNPDFATLQYFKANNIRYPIRPPAGARQPREGESVYCYCRCPYDEVSEMIACDGENCLIEWFHFECVGIMVAPQGKWFCAECRPKYSEELYPSTAAAGQLTGV